MRIHLLAVGERMPRWIREGFEQFSRRLPPQCALMLREIPAGRRSRGACLERIRAEEGARLSDAIPPKARRIALDVGGQRWSTEALAERLDGWLHEGRPVALLIGGPDGLAPASLAGAERWSLSPLTLPHGLVRIIVAEQLYRAWTIIRGHPYHRGDGKP